MADPTPLVPSFFAGATRVALLATVVCASSLAPVAPVALAQQGRQPDLPRTDVDVSSMLSRSQLREKAIGVLVEATHSDSAMIRANAIEALQKVPNRSLEAVRRGLRDDNLGVRFVAAMSASELRLIAAVPDLQPLLRDPEPVVRAAAICALRNCGVEVDPTPLARMLASPDRSLRANAAFVLGEMGDKSAVPMLRDMANEDTDTLLPSEQRLFRIQIAESLIKLGWRDAIDAVRAALYPSSSEEIESAILAAQIIGEVRDRGSAPELVNRIEDRVSGSQEYLMPPELRMAAATSLAKLGYTDGRYVALEYITSEADPLRAQAVITLGYTGSALDLQILDAMMTDDPSIAVEVSAASAILTLGERVGMAAQ